MRKIGVVKRIKRVLSRIDRVLVIGWEMFHVVRMMAIVDPVFSP